MNRIHDLQGLDNLLGAVYVVQDVTKDGMQCLIAFEDGSMTTCHYHNGQWHLADGPSEILG
jgi:hypothetical protein